MGGARRSTTNGESAYFLSVNRNKLSVALDLDVEADRALLLALAGEADVVVENFRPGTLERRGIDPTALLDGSPATRSGAGSPASGLEMSGPGYDAVIQAESGLDGDHRRARAARR